MICRKCNAPGALVIRKDYCYCNDCFIINTNHKFRACIGKNKILSRDEKVLICLSSGASSTVLLDLVHTGLSLNNHKKLRIVPHFLHVKGTSRNQVDEETTDLVIDQCKKYNYNVLIIDINAFYSKSNLLSSEDSVDYPNTFDRTFREVSATTTEDMLTNIKQNLYKRVAEELKCKLIFTGETTTGLAVRLLSNLTIGRGSQVENDIGFIDNRNESVKIIRPMRDISKEEVDHYAKIKQLKYLSDVHVDVSLQSVISNFVLDLQETSPATISTVCKTADKLGTSNSQKAGLRCAICQSNVDLKNEKLTAIEATIFSRQVSFKQVLHNVDFANLQKETDENNPLFPFIHESLCYCCSRNYSELPNCNPKNNIQLTI